MPTDKTKLKSIYSKASVVGREADTALIESLKKQFPIENKNYYITVDNVHAEPKTFDEVDEKDAILQSKSLTYPIRGDLKLFSKVSGKQLDEVRDFNLMDAFHLTDKHTIVYKGNNYTIANLLQLRSGVYTRTRENTGELESHFNTLTGSSLSIVLDPKSQVFNIEIGGSSNSIAPLLTKVFQIPSATVERYIPKSVWESNVAASVGKEDKVIKSLYNRMVYHKDPNATVDQMTAALRDSLSQTTLDPETTHATLGKGVTAVTPETLLLTLQKLVKVHRGDLPEDNRDSLQFKTVQNLPNFLKTKFDKEHDTVRAVKRNLTFGLEKMDPNNPRIKSAIPNKPWSKVYSSYLQSSSLISTPSETNPIESLENVGKVTVLGPEEGGISSPRGVPMAARNIDPSNLGILDPSRTPESGNAGIDQRFSISARKDDKGRLYAKVKDLNGKETYLSAQEMMSNVVGFRDSVEGAYCQAQNKGVLSRVPVKSVNYWLGDATNMYTVTTNLVPFMNSNHPGRLTMAGKSLPQALSLTERESPLVQTLDENRKPFVTSLGRLFSNKSRVDGQVTKVTKDEVHVKDNTGTTHKVRAVRNLPFNMKGFIDDEKPLVEVGQHIKADDPLYENNYTKNGDLALGKNLNVAYMPWKGYNHEDGIVISESAAKSLSSHHAYKIDYEVTPDTIAKKALLKRYFPGKFTPEQLDKLDDSGYAKPGISLEYGDPAYAVLEKREPSPEDRVLGRLHKTLVNPYRLVTEPWHNQEQGAVVDAHTSSKSVRILARSVKQLEIGDKITGLHGNKGIISLVVPDADMPYGKESGKPVDLILNPASVTSRVNLGQLMETAASKIAEKTGKPYLVKNFEHGNNLATIQKELKQHGLSDTEQLVDPKENRTYDKVLTGKQYILKLYKTTGENWSSRSVGGYDNVYQPTKGGEEGSKSVGYMESLGLLGSDARKNLKEMYTVKSEQNDDYWAKFIRGEPLPKPKTTFATEKFFNYLRGSGINTKIENGNIVATPLTDHDILAMSNGEVKEPKMLEARNLEPEEGGLFDHATTGGLRGEKWTHYRLAEPIVNPAMENPVKSILGINGTEFDKITSGEYGVKKIKDNLFHLVDTKDNSKVRDIKV